MESANGAQARREPPAWRRIESLTGLRFLAALLVTAFHVYFSVGARHYPAIAPLFVAVGPSAVSFFFILSGFVLTWSYRPGTPDTTFYRRRFARIAPAHLVTATVTALLFLSLHIHLSPGALLSIPLLQSWFPTSSVYFGLNAVSWSLGCEVFFYALFPLILGAAIRLSANRRKLVMAALVAAIFGVALA